MELTCSKHCCRGALESSVEVIEGWIIWWLLIAAAVGFEAVCALGHTLSAGQCNHLLCCWFPSSWYTWRGALGVGAFYTSGCCGRYMCFWKQAKSFGGTSRIAQSDSIATSVLAGCFLLFLQRNKRSLVCLNPGGGSNSLVCHRSGQKPGVYHEYSPWNFISAEVSLTSSFPCTSRDCFSLLSLTHFPLDGYIPSVVASSIEVMEVCMGTAQHQFSIPSLWRL